MDASATSWILAKGILSQKLAVDSVGFRIAMACRPLSPKTAVWPLLPQ